MASVHPSTPANLVVWMPQIAMCIFSLICSGANFVLFSSIPGFMLIHGFRHGSSQLFFSYDS
jgi:hypothetical protein